MCARLSIGASLGISCSCIRCAVHIAAGASPWDSLKMFFFRSMIRRAPCRGELAHIAGVEPAVRRQHFFRLLLVLVVALKGPWAPL